VVQQAPGQTGGSARSVSVQPGLAGAWTLDLFGRVRNLEGAARARYIASRADRDAARLAVISATVRGYVTLLSLAAQVEVSRNTLTSRDEALRIASDRARLGYSSQFELTQAQSEYEAVAQTIPVLEQATCPVRSYGGHWRASPCQPRPPVFPRPCCVDGRIWLAPNMRWSPLTTCWHRAAPSSCPTCS
jgi:hypothetical protein